jgi:hypothetical protein
MESNELKIAQQLATITESHWFNPAVLGRYLSNQPLYTIDRIMEMVVQIIRYQDLQFAVENQNGRTSEGLFLAHQLNKDIQKLAKKYDWQNIKLPK